MPTRSNPAVRIASSQAVTTWATMLGILLFVGFGSQLLPSAISGAVLPSSAASLKVAFLLNIALILFGWRRSKDLRAALEAHEEAEDRARRNANTDPLTGLLNRRELIGTLTGMIEARAKGSLLLLDLDHFKRVNDLHGHSTGDRLLQCVAEILTAAGPPDMCCARVGGDEFAAVLPQTGIREAERCAEDILARLSGALPVGNIQVYASASIGLTAVDGCTSAEAALHQADVALYAAKGQGRNCVAWFDAERERELAAKLDLEEALRRGIERGEFVPYFQPLIDLESRELVGFEALARWNSPVRGLLEAEKFIDAAENSGLVGPLTMAVLERALHEARDWPQHLKLAVNISPIQFRDNRLAEQIEALLAAAGFPASRLEIEITEASLLEDRDQVTAIIRRLKAAGVSISLDDFGTGYASLAQVQSLPIDRIKIDRSFISTIVKSERTAAIVSAITNLGHTFQVPITAEGVESEQISQALRATGCSEAQGWLYGRAISGETVRAFLSMRPVGDAPRRAASPTLRGPK